ncbi:MAG TPA: fructose-bisphosphatase class I, partial [Paracoccaceae bacterium]|nr:fructose-bisphosphatase class I [Paracoccaceae bacterium]
MTKLITSTTPIPAELEPTLNALAKVAAELSVTISRGVLGGQLGAEVGDNSDGDTQKALDVMADEAFAAELRGTGVRWYASEEQDSVVELDSTGALAVAIDPLDGSSNIDVNVSIGTIFGIQPALDAGEATF